jgi:hypothetical protein
MEITIVVMRRMNILMKDAIILLVMKLNSGMVVV